MTKTYQRFMLQICFIFFFFFQFSYSQDSTHFQPILKWKSPQDTIFIGDSLSVQSKIDFGKEAFTKKSTKCGKLSRVNLFTEDTIPWLDIYKNKVTLGWDDMQWNDSTKLFEIIIDTSTTLLPPRIFLDESVCAPHEASAEYTVEICYEFSTGTLCKNKSAVVLPKVSLNEEFKDSVYHVSVTVFDPSLKGKEIAWDLNNDGQWDFVSKELNQRILPEKSLQWKVGIKSGQTTVEVIGGKR